MNNSSPSISCEAADIYTTTDSSTGNKALTQPIGLISADEAMFAGIPNWNSSNSNNYLDTRQYYWTMSPSNFNTDSVTRAIGVRPVINLRADVQITGSGTTTDPYKVVGAE